MPVEKEEWKQSILPKYEISNLGRVRNKKTQRVIALEQEEKGYYRLSIVVGGVKKHFAVHRLVAIAFIPNVDGKPQVDHINGDKSNNRVENLRWVTDKENTELLWERKKKTKQEVK